jgi:3-oxoacyl-[acyl-carrier protein] reductase
MRIELFRLRALVDGSAKGIRRAIAETLAANGTEAGISGSKRTNCQRVIAEICGMAPSRRLVRAPGDTAGEVDILFNDVGT